MADDPLRILQVNTFDAAGGAASVCWNLFQAYRSRGHRSRLAVGHKHSSDPDVVVIGERAAASDSRGANGSTASLLTGSQETGHWARLMLARVGQMVGDLQDFCGLENFRYASTWQLLNAVHPPPQILHCHNLHGGYFDLRALPWLSRQLPVVLTLHDAWLLSGHCAHSFDCDRWTTGCGSCPDLTIYPAIRRDATAHNWRRKRRLYRASRLHVATPSRWLMERVERSMLASGLAESRVIPNGVDLDVFKPAERNEIRASLRMEPEAWLILFASHGIRQNIWKDYQTLRTAVELLSRCLDGATVQFIALGEQAPPEQLGAATIQFVPFQNRPEDVARYYQAADIYVHAAKVDTFPNTILEALACGTPVVATAVGGISEQVRSLECLTSTTLDVGRYRGDVATGVLVKPGDADGLAVSIEALLRDRPVRLRLGENARRDAAQRFDLQRQVDRYLEWYQELIAGRDRGPVSLAPSGPGDVLHGFRVRRKQNVDGPRSGAIL